MSDEDVKKEYAAAGVDLPELKDAPKEEPKEETPKDDPAPEPEKDEEKEPLQDKPKEPRKRSIYDDLKDERKDRKDAETRAADAEKQRDELAEKLRLATEGKGTDIDAAEDAIAYAIKIGADPDLVQRIISDARKGVKPELDEDTKKDLADFKAWKSSNAKTVETQMFNDEFERTLPALKSYFPNASDDEMKVIKGQLDTISHSKEWHDKDLDYIAFKNKDTLGALVSPKKRGMEGKGRADADAAADFEFDPNADYTKMSPKEKEKWEVEYRKLGKQEGLLTDSKGGKTMI